MIFCPRLEGMLRVLLRNSIEHGRWQIMNDIFLVITTISLGVTACGLYLLLIKLILNSVMPLNDKAQFDMMINQINEAK